MCLKNPAWRSDHVPSKSAGLSGDLLQADLPSRRESADRGDSCGNLDASVAADSTATGKGPEPPRFPVDMRSGEKLKQPLSTTPAE
ncbi:hypothetical protein BR93DRAFT_531587 [Coniochaeta sp. PMI_546]|nr:hypothetical protein BR93DRAFT_531587 [Coniochaeta sp. PMI_546]